jgi:2-polyprenyl-6-methoxyphenol hydroxylase-like FAD-dependent oxidoreductase
MSDSMGEQAVIIGAGMGGLTAARALSGFFSRVVVVERDELPTHASQRPGIPQGRHLHTLLGGGQRALDELFPGFEHYLAAAGAVPYRVGLDIRVERPGFHPFPQRDLGWHGYAMSRPLIESVVRRCVAQHANVSLRPHCSVREILPTADGTAVKAVRYETGDGRSETLAADFVVDASGRGTPTLAFLEACGRALPPESSIGVDIHYATAVFAVPNDAPPDWKGVIVLADPQVNSRGALMVPVEDGRWILTVSAAHGDSPPGDTDGFMDFVRQLRTPTIHAAIHGAERLGNIARFAFPASVRRHFDQIEDFPRGLLPVADAICRFNPLYGQGMSVAAQEACVLRRLLGSLVGQWDPMARLASSFFDEVGPLLDTPWAVAGLDFIYPQTRGQRPADFENTLKFTQALNRVAARDPSVHKVMLEVQHLLKPRSVYREPEFMRRIAAEMAFI